MKEAGLLGQDDEDGYVSTSLERFRALGYSLLKEAGLLDQDDEDG